MKKNLTEKTTETDNVADELEGTKETLDQLRDQFMAGTIDDIK